MWKIFHYGELRDATSAIIVERFGTSMYPGEGGMDYTITNEETEVLTETDAIVIASSKDEDEKLLAQLAQGWAEDVLMVCEGKPLKVVSEFLLDAGIWWSEVRALFANLSYLRITNAEGMFYVDTDDIETFTEQLTKAYKTALRRNMYDY